MCRGGLGLPGTLVARFAGRLGLVAVNLQNLTVCLVDTFESRNGSSTIDYIVVPEFILDGIREYRVSDWNPGFE